MSFISDFLEEKLIDHLFRNTPYSAPGTVYLALYSSDPTDANTGSEISGSAYTRKPIVLSAPINGVAYNSADILFDTASADWATVTHVGIMDASAIGNLMMYGPLSSPITITSGNNFRIPAGNFGIGFD